MTLERRKKEIELLRKKYGELEHGEGLDWVLFSQFPLPPGWNRDVTELLILVPAGYPTTAPDNFYVRNGLRTEGGGAPGNYSESQTVLGGSWAQFSFHAQSWNASEDIEDGDNLLTFVLAVERRLREFN